jgi:hypothetical protein
MMSSDSAARQCAIASIMQVLDGQDAASQQLLHALFPNWPERETKARVPSKLREEVRQTVLHVVDGLAQSIRGAKGSKVPKYFQKFADRWARAAGDETARRALVGEESLRLTLLQDLRDLARSPDMLAKINAIVIELNVDRIDRRLLVNAFEVVEWALKRARPAPKGLSIWYENFRKLYIPEAEGSGALVIRHVDYLHLASGIAKNGLTDLGLIIDFANHMAKRLVAEHPDVQAIRQSDVDQLALMNRALFRDLAPPSRRRNNSAPPDMASAPFWDVHDRHGLRDHIDNVRRKDFRPVIKDGCLRLLDPQERPVSGREASILECLIMVHGMSYAMIARTRSKVT